MSQKITLADKVISFNANLKFTGKLPDDVEVMNPFRDEIAKSLSAEFYHKFYSDNNTRRLLIGINPGRFGGGVTGIPFTDPVKLEENCGIENPYPKSTEPSAGFIYTMIDRYGGVEKFYSRFLIWAASPLGFLKNGLNYNYYDSKELLRASRGFIMDNLRQVMDWEVDSSVCYCLGNGKNYKYLVEFNREAELFSKIIPLPHPRWIVQYRRKKMDEFVELYLDAIQ